MLDADATRKRVSKTYADALTPAGAGCCDPAEVGARRGYDAAEIATLPGDAVANAFGCGDPVTFSGIEPGDVVLDLGSGAGIDLLLAARKAGPEGKVIGVDMTGEMIERARANIARAGADNVEVRKGVIEDLPVEDSSVDWVISNCVINLSPEKPKVFSEIARVLKPGGRMMVSDIVAERLPPSLRRSQAAYDSCIGGAIPEEQYLEGLRAAGLSEVEALGRREHDRAFLAEVAATESRWIRRLPGAMRRGVARLAARYLEGRIASVRFAAVKPE